MNRLSIYHIVLVAIGGGVGSALRLIVGRWLAVFATSGFPWPTLCVNILGSFAMGLLMAGVMLNGVSETSRLLLGVGLLGGFTTFSAFSYECVELMARGQMVSAFIYISLSLVAGICALWAGLFIVRLFA